MKTCPYCSSSNDDNAYYCTKCGRGMTTEKPTVCPNCGQPFKPGENLCGNCGKPKLTPPPQWTDHSIKPRKFKKWKIILLIVVFLPFISMLFAYSVRDNINTQTSGKNTTTKGKTKTTTNGKTKTTTNKEVWAGTLTGIYNEHDGNYSPCLGNLGGAFSENHRVKITFPSSLAKHPRGRGSFSASETILRRPSYSYMQLMVSSTSNVPITAIVGGSRSAKLEIDLQPDTGSLWVSRSTLSGSLFTAPHKHVVLFVTSMSNTSVSGTWKSYPFGAKGNFKLTKQ